MTDIRELFVSGDFTVEVRPAGPNLGGTLICSGFWKGCHHYELVFGTDTWYQWQAVLEAELQRLDLPSGEPQEDSNA